MKSKILNRIINGIVISALSVLYGCGGGGGGGSSAPAATSVSSKSSSVRTRVIATTRINRAILAISGLGRNITRAAGNAPTSAMGSRIPLFFIGLNNSVTDQAKATRGSARSLFLGGKTNQPPSDITQDPSTGLYYTVTVNADGSGEELLYTDVTATTPAGSFVWQTPQWAGGLANHYPATIHVTYNITAGNFAGDSGSLVITVEDSSFKNGLIALVLKDNFHESANCNCSLLNGALKFIDSLQFSDGSSCSGTVTQTAVGDLDSVFDFSDGSYEDINVQPDGTATETYKDSAGTTEATGTVQSNGDDTILYDNGSASSSGSSGSAGSSGSTDNSGSSGSTDTSETVNVDTGDSTGDGGSASGDSSDSGDSGMAVKRTHWLSIPPTLRSVSKN